MKQFKIRCSAIGQIMGNLTNITENQLELLSQLQAKQKLTDKQRITLDELIIKRDTPSDLSDTAKTYCQNWTKQQIYGRRKEITSKYTEKGLIMEDNSLDYIAEQQDLGMLIKNESYFENDYMCGTPDVILPNLIIDVKNSWDCFTFPLFENDVPNSTYWWQGQGYMELVNRDNYELIYVLSDTPLHLIQREAYWYCKNNGYDDLTEEIYNDFVKKMTYQDVADEYKIKIFPFKKDTEAIKQIEQQVIKCRNYIETLI
jgi:predicted ribosome quality control (RQC) complex YloA/Tae2 family protein